MKNTATITLSDDGTDEVRVKCEFSGEGANNDSAAHRTAAAMMANAIELSEGGDLDVAVGALKRLRDAHRFNTAGMAATEVHKVCFDALEKIEGAAEVPHD